MAVFAVVLNEPSDAVTERLKAAYPEPAHYQLTDFQNPADQSWVLQILLDLKGSFGRVEERTATLSKTMDGLSADIRTIQNDMVTSKMARWLVALVVSVILALGGILYQAITTQRPEHDPVNNVHETTSQSPHPTHRKTDEAE